MSRRLIVQRALMLVVLCSGFIGMGASRSEAVATATPRLTSAGIGEPQRQVMVAAGVTATPQPTQTPRPFVVHPVVHLSCSGWPVPVTLPRVTCRLQVKRLPVLDKVSVTYHVVIDWVVSHKNHETLVTNHHVGATDAHGLLIRPAFQFQMPTGKGISAARYAVQVDVADTHHYTLTIHSRS